MENKTLSRVQRCTLAEIEFKRLAPLSEGDVVLTYRAESPVCLAGGYFFAIRGRPVCEFTGHTRRHKSILRNVFTFYAIARQLAVLLIWFYFRLRAGRRRPEIPARYCPGVTPVSRRKFSQKRVSLLNPH